METISLENRAKNIKFEHDRHQGFIEDALEGIEKHGECLPGSTADFHQTAKLIHGRSTLKTAELS
ncbi:MAG: hypothetical protein JRE14_12340 [Deltaproteobacteria bacterium]|nr:hypothetical protein [Deltaproteobacteria bacterium]